MPHTSHRKKKHVQNKRTEILDDDGWTRISSSSTSTGKPPPTTSTPTGNETSSAAGPHILSASGSLPARDPMPALPGSSLPSMLSRFNDIESRWQATDLCKTLTHVLEEEILTRHTGQIGPVSTCVMLGSGSFCGDAAHWIDRHDSAYFQLAAFRTIVHTVERVSGQRVRTYAQEPNYNDLDAELLKSLDITRVDHPRGFELLDEHAVAYSPAAEREVEAGIMARKPRVWLHRSLDYLLEEGGLGTRSAVEFATSHDHRKLPALDVKNFPFHGSVIWWRKREQDPDHGQDHPIEEIDT
ncbi:hypothetical protein G647_05661 [Cladophialophora carrionii CBS 160.54]|uniref:SRR1-like domain-containing protein n=1 Tax=Cladophialophora carrionii CBS 160.54 TaxID=1279043 RepID=V9DAC6_9EURO|nr:uncharacterized protein G647_05661 [Cladophialophora carrionii CBS 160.54]ETI23854.1 hypothetical protein G647_05661 [Cladophialophora carrionii CBS 160.54]